MGFLIPRFAFVQNDSANYSSNGKFSILHDQYFAFRWNYLPISINVLPHHFTGKMLSVNGINTF